MKHHFPNSFQHEDIRTTDFTIWRGRIDLLTGGDPCQPNSVAGLGKGTADDRFLWPEMFRAIREIRPAWIVNENVDGSVANGVLDLKIDDLESEGYACQAYDIPAEAVGALHQRGRIWLVAHNPDRNNDYRTTGKNGISEGKKRLSERNTIQLFGQPVDLWPYAAYPDAERLKEQYTTSQPGTLQEGMGRYFGFGPDPYGNIPRHIIESGIIGMLNGLPEGMDYADRGKRIKAIGNAIVWEVAYEIFKAIEEYENNIRPCE